MNFDTRVASQTQGPEPHHQIPYTFGWHNHTCPTQSTNDINKWFGTRKWKLCYVLSAVELAWQTLSSCKISTPSLELLPNFDDTERSPYTSLYSHTYNTPLITATTSLPQQNSEWTTNRSTTSSSAPPLPACSWLLSSEPHTWYTMKKLVTSIFTFNKERRMRKKGYWKEKHHRERYNTTIGGDSVSGNLNANGNTNMERENEDGDAVEGRARILIFRGIIKL